MTAMADPELEIGDRVCPRHDVDEETSAWRTGTVIEKYQTQDSGRWFYTIRWDTARDLATRNFAATDLCLLDRPTH
jgi:hypothetical protein